jgi:hypothetical protein
MASGKSNVAAREYTPEEQKASWDHYFSIQLTPEQKAAARAEAEKAAAKAAAEGVYEDLLAMIGKVKWSLPLEGLRDEDED